MPVKLLLALGLVIFGDLELFLCGAAWAAQLLYVLTELLGSMAAILAGAVRSWACVLFGYLVSSKVALDPQEWIAAAVVQLWVLHVSYLTVGMRLERWQARSSVQTDLCWAMRQPFHAKLEEDFSKAPCLGHVQGDPPPLKLRRSLSFVFLHETVVPPAELERLNECHAALLMARHQVLDELELAEPPANVLSLEVRREYVLQDTWRALLDAPPFELLAERLVVTYLGEDGVDAGGLRLDWFDAAGQSLVEGSDDDLGSSLLALGKSSRMLIPRPRRRECSTGGEEDETRCRELLLTGRLLALGVVHGGRPLPAPLSPLVCKYILGQPVDMGDVELVDPAFYRERVSPLLRPGGLLKPVFPCSSAPSLRRGGLAEMENALGETLTFVSVPTELRPQPEELEPGGASTVVTEQNRERYLQLLCEAFLCSEIRQELQCVLHGFWDVLPQEALRQSGITAKDFAALISGARGIDVKQWHSQSREEVRDLCGHSEQHDAREELAGQIISWFWQSVQEFEEEKRRLLLRFVTGSARLPPGGFASLRPPFTVAVSDTGSADHLPCASTCVNRLVLRLYTSKQQLQDKLLQALAERDFALA